MEQAKVFSQKYGPQAQEMHREMLGDFAELDLGQKDDLVPQTEGRLGRPKAIRGNPGHDP